jgi:large subunit ribosomal protein L25
MVYGAGKKNERLLLDSNEIDRNLGIEAFHSAIISLKTDSVTDQVILREVQMHPHHPLVIHVDFQRVKATEKLHIKVPVHFEGAEETPGVKVDGGVLSYLMTEFDITCLPKDLPEYIAVDVSFLSINESIHLSEVTLPEGVEYTAASVHEGQNPTVATVTPPKVVEEEEVVEEGEEGDEALGEESAIAAGDVADSGTPTKESTTD